MNTWTAVEDQLPPVGQAVVLLSMTMLADLDSGRHVTEIGCLLDEAYTHGGYWSVFHSRGRPLGTFTHWLPLPAEPEAT